MSTVKNKIGQRFGSLVVTSREGSYAPNKQATWNCQCDCGDTTIVRSSHLSLGYVKSCGDRTVHPQVGRNKAQGYNQTHQKIRRILGSATEYGCSGSDCDAWASEWAYDHLDANEVRTPDGTAYSTDPEHYVPYCAKHHRQFDAEFNARLRGVVANMRRAIGGPVSVLDHQAFAALRLAIETAEVSA
jgi:hypothetical protein